MTQFIVKHKVADYPSWRKAFDDHKTTRVNQGVQSSKVFQASENPNDVMVYFEWDSEEHARSFAASEDLKETMKRAGVLEQPSIYFIDNAH